MTPTERQALALLLEGCPPHGMTLTCDSGPWPKGTGIRPELLSVNQQGGHNYRVTKEQADRFAKRIRSELEGLVPHAEELDRILTNAMAEVERLRAELVAFLSAPPKDAAGRLYLYKLLENVGGEIANLAEQVPDAWG